MHPEPSPRAAAPAIKWTPQQLQAIITTGRGLLVSAAAGSGKTAVLAERCVHLVCDASPRVNLNQLLVVTFTEAAASEMKSRIERALLKRLQLHPDDDHLRRQVALAEHAQISTLHSFCNRLIRQHFHRLGLDPAFRLLDAAEARLLQLDAVHDLFARRYDAANSADFCRFIDGYGETGDEALMQLVVRTHELLNSLVHPRRWMAGALDRLSAAAAGPLDRASLGREFLDLVEQRCRDLARDTESAAAAVQRLGVTPYHAYLLNLLQTAQDWIAILQHSGYDGLVTAARGYSPPRCPPASSKAAGKDAAQVIVKAVQAQFSRGPLIDALAFSSAQWEEGLARTLPHARVFLQLIEEFHQGYQQRKQADRLLDFADLERYALRLLAEPAGPDDARPTPSSVARQLHRQFQHVLVDEYQDINEVQDTLLSLVSRDCIVNDGAATPNLFCVGDVKQSIYGFRLAEPSRFLDRTAAFRADPLRAQVIDLQDNFRSRAPLLHAVNAIFERMMTRVAADIEYDASHRLNPHADFPAPEPALPGFSGAPIELHLLPDKLIAADAAESEDETDDELERAQREALIIAQRIRDWMGQADTPRRYVAAPASDRTPGYRPIEYRDIVILLRATQFHADAYADILRRSGIPVFTAGGRGFFEAMEIRDMLSLLRLLDNVAQDVPLAAVLRSPLGALPSPEDNLVRIRLACPAQSFHEAAQRYAAERDDDLAAKLRDFFRDLDRWRSLARQRPIAEVLWTIYEESGFLAFCSGLLDGNQRCANLIALHERAAQFSAFSRQGLYRFIQFLESLRDETDAAPASDVSEAENVVRIMSIHKAKGLEFPVVIVPSLGKRFNLRDCSGQILVDRRAFLGLQAVDFEKRIRYPSLASSMVSHQLRRQALAEEMRILYVAMTRAREHLVLVGTCPEKAMESWSRRWDLHAGPLPPDTVLAANTPLAWLGPVSAMLSCDAGQHLQLYPHPPDEIQQAAADLGQRRRAARVADNLAQLQPLHPAPADHPAAQRAIERLRFGYPHLPFASLEAARSVTQWAKSAPPTAPSPAAPPMINLPEPRCLLEDSTLSAADRGTAVHLFLEKLDYTRPCTDADLAAQLKSLHAAHVLSAAQAAAVNLADVRWFIDSPVGQLIRASAPRLLRELPVNLAVPPDEFLDRSSAEPLDQVMLRGRLDLLIPDDRGFILVDYKSDHVQGPAFDERIALYRGQMAPYCTAIERIARRPVHTTHLAFISLRRIVTL